jgi:hypothetical protein
MRWSVVVTLVVAFIAVGIVGFLLYPDRPSNLSPLPPQPEDEPLLVLEPPDPDADLPALVALPDLSQVDRRIVEPTGLVKPRYCLLVFGPEAKTRVWLVEDGDTLYVDRNANGDLTDAGEAVALTKREEFITVAEDGKETPYREWTYSAGDLSPADGSGKHTGLELVRYQTGGRPAEYVLSVWVDGVTLQQAGWGPLFADSRATAPVVHFGGPIVAKPLRSSGFRLGAKRPELHLCIGTPGLGDHSFAYVGCEAVPGVVRPVVEIAWPAEGAVVKERFALARRC